VTAPAAAKPASAITRGPLEGRAPPEVPSKPAGCKVAARRGPPPTPEAVAVKPPSNTGSWEYAIGSKTALATNPPACTRGGGSTIMGAGAGLATQVGGAFDSASTGGGTTSAGLVTFGAGHANAPRDGATTRGLRSGGARAGRTGAGGATNAVHRGGGFVTSIKGARAIVSKTAAKAWTRTLMRSGRPIDLGV